MSLGAVAEDFGSLPDGAVEQQLLAPDEVVFLAGVEAGSQQELSASF